MIRPAKFSDIPDICSLMAEGHKKSTLSAYPINVKRKLKPLLMDSIRSGTKCVYVAIKDEKVIGFIVGVIDDLYHILDVKYVADLFFYVAKDDRGEGGALFDAFIAWGKSQKGVVRIRPSATNVVGSYERTAKMYARKGFTQEGVIFDMEVSS